MEQLASAARKRVEEAGDAIKAICETHRVKLVGWAHLRGGRMETGVDIEPV